MDSFVYEAKEYADLIYGDEGIDGPPPYYGFSKPHRINSGLLDRRDAGLTTGHCSLLPDGVGRDEFIGAEYTMSGPRGASSGGYVPGDFGPPQTGGDGFDPQAPMGGWPTGGESGGGSLK